VSPGDALVSVCIPTFNRARFIESALDSALAQTYQPLEVIVVDDASQDDTVERVRAYDDPRIRLWVNRRQVGQSENRNRTIARAHGQLIKFLDSDDELAPDCVERMVELFAQDSAIGLVFARRRISYEGTNPLADQVWRAKYGTLDRGFGVLKRVNDGPALFARCLVAGLRENWIGEPSAVMVRRSHLALSGGFGTRVVLNGDIDLWLRLLSHCLVGFIDADLVVYRRGHDSVTGQSGLRRNHWTDLLWTLEALAGDGELCAIHPELHRLLRAERRQAWRTAARLGHPRGGAAVPLQPYLSYLRFRALSLIGSPPALFPPLAEGLP
jgi:glycosyltransferase involved in cell wall biosynthesis